MTRDEIKSLLIDYGCDHPSGELLDRLASEQPRTDEIDFEVWQDDMLVASSTSEADARHYLAVYSQDGPATLMRAETRRTRIDQALGEGR